MIFTQKYLEYWDDIFERVAAQEDYFGLIDDFFGETKWLTEMTLQHENVKKLLESDAEFDLLFIEVFLNDAFLGMFMLVCMSINVSRACVIIQVVNDN